VNLDTILLGLLLWVAASIPLSLAMAARMRGVAAREARSHRGPRPVRVPRPPREFRAPRETRSLEQLRLRLSVTGMRSRRLLRRSDLTQAA